MNEIAEDGPTLHPLISLLPKAHGVPVDDLEGIKTDTWEDEDSTWHVKLNGSGQTHYPVVSPIGDSWPDPSRVEMFAGTFLVIVDDEALMLVHPTHIESFINPGDDHAARVWETATIHAVHDRLEDVALDEDLPPAEEFIRPGQRDEFRQTVGESR